VRVRKADSSSTYVRVPSITRLIGPRRALSGWRFLPGRGSMRGMTMAPNPYRGFRFPPKVIQHAIWLYHCFSPSWRYAELILVARVIVVSYKSIRTCASAGSSPEASPAATGRG
jgi:hypothetical protein